jgi:hypothetical protein
MSVDSLLSRLDRVRKTGAGRWISCCPAHDDRGPSLAVRELEDGRVLLHCFAGCDTSSVLDAAGLTFEDLFPERLSGDLYKRERRPFNAMDVLICLSMEVLIAYQCAVVLSKGECLSDADQARLLVAASRFQSAMGAINA